MLASAIESPPPPVLEPELVHRIHEVALAIEHALDAFSGHTVVHTLSAARKLVDLTSPEVHH